MSEEIHRADWSIPYPKDLDEKNVTAVLGRLTDIEHDWEVFPWHLTGSMLKLLHCPQRSYEYLHLVWFFRARAAMLALKGQVLDLKDLFRALCKHQVQVGGIYRKHLIWNMEEFLRKENLAEIPDCHREDCDGGEADEKIERNRRTIRSVVRASEREYVKTLNFISVAETMDEEVARHTVGFWVKGGEKPNGNDIPARVRRFEGGYEVRPTENDVKRMIKIGQPFEKIMVRTGESTERAGSKELGALRAERESRAEGGNLKPESEKRGRDGERSQKSGVRSQNGEEDRRTECGSHSGGRGQKKKDGVREPATDAIAQKAAEIVLAAVAPALRCSKLNPDRDATDDLVQAFTLERKKRATDGETFTALARLDIEMARKTPDKAPWMRLSDAHRHYSRAVRGEAVRAGDIATRAVALERRYRRAVREAGG